MSTARSAMTYDERQARYDQVLAWRAAGLTFTEIGRRLGVSAQRVRDITRRAERRRQRAMERLMPHSPLSTLPLEPGTVTALERRGRAYGRGGCAPE